MDNEAKSFLERIAEGVERGADALQSLARAFGRRESDPRYPEYVPPPFPCGPYPSPTVDPIINPPQPLDAVFDRAEFEWSNPGSWRRFIAPVTKYLPVPNDYSGTVKLFVSSTTGNSVDFATVTITDGPKIVAQELANVTAWYINFNAVGGRSYGISVDTPGAVLSINRVVG